MAEEDDAEESQKEGGDLSFFGERSVVVQFILKCCSPAWETSFSNFDRITLTLSKYQEQPVLLNPHLTEMLSPITTRMLEMVSSSGSDDPTISPLQKSDEPQFHALCKIVQLCCRVRGYKHVMKLFPHEVSHLELCLSLIRAQDSTDYETWETRYVLLLWLCILCLIPFDICSMDSSLSSHFVSEQAVQDRQSKSSLVQEIVDISRGYLSDPGPTRDAACACLSSLLTRPDMEIFVCGSFFEWSGSVIDGWTERGDAAVAELTSGSFQFIGVLQTMAQIFKKGERGRLLPPARTFLSRCVAISTQQNQVLTRKLATKLIQRIGMAFLPPRVAAWRYQRGKRSLMENLNKGIGSTGGVASSSNVDNNKSIITAPSDDESDFDVSVELEDVLDRVLDALSDKDTVVRWSAAKGVGRITMRLPQSYANDVVGAVLALFTDPEADSAWHGGCLALAELSRRGLLLPERLEEVVPLINAAIQFDVLRGQHSVGAHVRDAACYVCWSFARAYSPEVMKSYVRELSAAMVITALFDREINCRRAASAAFQEHVGRQGNENFPNGIEIITIADYFSLGNRVGAYMDIAPRVSYLDLAVGGCLHEALLHHLLEVKLMHWDSELRMLASRTIVRLIEVGQNFPQAKTPSAAEVISLLLPKCLAASLAARHGAVLALAELVLASSLRRPGGTEPLLPSDVLVEITTLVPRIDKARLYRGRGGELFRQASCLLLENIARGHLPMATKTQIPLVELLNENLKQPHEMVQRAAASALRQFTFTYFSSSAMTVPSERLQQLTVLKYLAGLTTAENVAVTRGYALALGCLPQRLAALPVGRLDEVFTALALAARPEATVAGEADVETRRAAVDAVVELAERFAFVLTDDQWDRSVEMLYVACEDYKTDKRGDTGSWCRSAALRGLERLHRARRRVRSDALGSGAGTTVLTSYGPARALQAVVTASDSDASVSHSYDICLSACGRGMLVQYPVGSLGHTVANDGTMFHAFHTSEPGGLEEGVLHINTEGGRAIVPATTVRDQEVTTIDDVLPTVPTSSTAVYPPAPPASPMNLQRAVSTMLKQLSEKLDAVREIAGQSLERLLLLTDDANGSEVLPERERLEGAMLRLRVPSSSSAVGANEQSSTSGEGPSNINWSQPAIVFPFLVDILSSPSVYFPSIFEGMVISVGGLSEAVVKEASAGLLAYCMLCEEGIGLEPLARMIPRMFDKYRGNDRIIVPLLKTIDLLLRSGALASLERSETLGATFATLLHESVSAEHATSQDVGKIRSCADVYILLLQWAEPARTAALKSLVILLGHKFPRVRKYTAETLYVQFLSDPNAIGPSTVATAALVTNGQTQQKCGFAESSLQLEKICEVLCETAWDGANIAAARAKRLELCGLMGLQMTIKPSSTNAKTTGDSKRSKTIQDENDSYEALVREAGY